MRNPFIATASLLLLGTSAEAAYLCKGMDDTPPWYPFEGPRINSSLILDGGDLYTWFGYGVTGLFSYRPAGAIFPTHVTTPPYFWSWGYWATTPPQTRVGWFVSEAYALPAAHIVNHENHPGQFILGENAEECYVGWDLGVMEQPYEQQIVWDEPNAKQGAFLEKFLTSY